MSNRFKRALEALGVPMPQNTKSGWAKLTAVTLSVVALLGNIGMAEAVTLGSSSVSLSDPRPSTTGVVYTFKGGAAGAVVQSVAIKCIKVTFSSSSSTVVTPTGFTAASATVDSTSTIINASTSGWTGTPTANSYTYTNSTGVTPTTTSGATFILNAITNSSVGNTGYYYNFNTYSNTDCSTTPLDNAQVQFINTTGSTLSLSVDQSLTFQVLGVNTSQSCGGSTSTQQSDATTIPFGSVTTASNGLVCQDLTASTNATNGYTIYLRYTAKPTNALGQTIADWTGSNTTPTTFSSAGTEAYGYSTNDITLGTGTAGRFTTNKYAAATTTNSEVAYESAGVSTATYRIAHQVGISTTTRPGSYSTTIIYTCTPVY